MSNETEDLTNATHRERGDQCIADAILHLSEADGTPTEPTELTHIGWAQALTLRAIYYELRHGNDLAARNSEVLAKNSEALAEHAEGMDDLRKALLHEGDMRGLGR